MSGQAAPAATLVIFGAMGDLAGRLLIPALVNLRRDGLVGDGLTVIGVDFSEGSDAALRAKLGEFCGGDDGQEEPDWPPLRARCSYLRGDFTDKGTFARLAEQLPSPGESVCFYLATTPQFFGGIVMSWTPEAVVLNESDPVFREIELVARDLTFVTDRQLQSRFCKRKTFCIGISCQARGVLYGFHTPGPLS